MQSTIPRLAVLASFAPLDWVFTEFCMAEFKEYPPDKAASSSALFEQRRGELLRQAAALTPATLDAWVADVFAGLVGHFFGSVANVPRLMEQSPAELFSARCFATLEGIFFEVCEASPLLRQELQTGERALASAMGGLAPSTTPSNEAWLLSVLEYFGDEVLPKRWGASDPWCAQEGPSKGRMVTHAASIGEVAHVRSALARCPLPDGPYTLSQPGQPGVVDQSPLLQAFLGGHEEVVAFLAANGASCREIPTFFVMSMAKDASRTGTPAAERSAVRARQLAMLKTVLELRPDAVHSLLEDQNTARALDFLQACITLNDLEVVKMALAAGAPIRKAAGKVIAPSGRSVEVRPTLVVALGKVDNSPIVEALVEAGALDDWKDWPATDQAELADAFAFAAVRAAKSKKAEHERIISALLSRGGFNVSVGANGENAFLSCLFPPPQFKCPLPEADALALLKRMHRAGFDVVSSQSAEAERFRRTGVRDWSAGGLPMVAAFTGMASVVDWLVDELGCRIDEARMERHSMLAVALRKGQYQFALHLLTKHKPKARHPELEMSQQPLSAVLDDDHLYTDAQAARLVDALFKLDPDFLDVPCFKEAAPPPLTATSCPETVTPILDCIEANKAQTLELLLTKSAVARDMATRRFMGRAQGVIPGVHTPTWLRPAQYATMLCRWDMLAVLMRHVDVKVTEAFPSVVGYTSLVFSIVDTLEKCGRILPVGTIPRGLKATITSAAKKEQAAARGGAPSTATFSSAAAPSIAAAAGPVDTTTNAFEDPSMSAAVGAAKGKNKKGKSKKGKKKSKSKKKAGGAASAGAGAATAGADDDDSDDSRDEEPFEEPDDNLVDSRYAPSLDAMLAERGMATGQQ